jgi:cytoskeleton protein RodZ
VDPATDTESVAAPPPTLGQALASERERQGLSRTEVAQRLHMSQWQIEALESSDYARLPKGTFLRGFVRNYAKVLGVDAEGLLSQLAQTAPKGPAPGIVVPSQNIRFDPIGERLSNPYVKAGGLAVVFIALGFAVMYWWLFIRPAPPAMAKGSNMPAAENIAAAPLPAPEPVMPSPAPTEPPRQEAAPPKVESPKAEPAKPAPPKAEPSKAAAPAVVEPPKSDLSTVAATTTAEPPKTQAPAPVRGPNDHTLKLTFRGESWVDIRDRGGRVLLQRINTPGSEAEIFGRPPFTIIIGNAPDVKLTYDGREFPLEPHTRVAVARFTLE